MGIIKSLRKKQKEKCLLTELNNLENSIYLQICLYKNRADTKYHRGIIDGLSSVRREIENIIDKMEE